MSNFFNRIKTNAAELLEATRKTLATLKSNAKTTWESGNTGKAKIIVIAIVVTAAVVASGAYIASLFTASAVTATVGFSVAGLTFSQKLFISLTLASLFMSIAKGHFKAIVPNLILIALLLSPVAATIVTVLTWFYVLWMFLALAILATKAYLSAKKESETEDNAEPFAA